MFLPNNFMIMTDKGSLNVGNISNNKIYTTDGFEDFNMSKKHEKTYFLKTDLFPTIAIGKNTELLTGKIYVKNDTVFIKNQFFKINEIRAGDYLVVPKTYYQSPNKINRTLCWLYAKYITSGYYCTERQTDRDMIVINLNKMSKKEALRLRRYSEVMYDLKKMQIIIKNKDIIDLFGKDKKHLIRELYNSEPHIIKYFLHTMQIENEFIKIEHKSIAYDLFIFLYSKLNKIMSITEEKTNRQKVFYLKDANPNDYILFKDLLYVKINNILEGKEASGLNISNPNDKKIHGVLMLIK